MTLKQITSVGLKREHYKADALILYCVDHRGKEALDEFTRAKGFKYYDLVQIPGGAKVLIVLGDATRGIIAKLFQWVTRWIILGWISTLLRLHHADEIIIVDHIDCGACGGSSAFGGQEGEYQTHERWLGAGRDLLKKEFPGVPVEAYFVDYDGFWQVV